MSSSRSTKSRAATDAETPGYGCDTWRALSGRGRARTFVAAARMRGRLRAGIAPVLAARGVVIDAIDAARGEHAGR